MNEGAVGCAGTQRLFNWPYLEESERSPVSGAWVAKDENSFAGSGRSPGFTGLGYDHARAADLLPEPEGEFEQQAEGEPRQRDPRQPEQHAFRQAIVAARFKA